ncbi:MAG: Mpo1-like protein [Bryobacteraceae bacterium]|jgi:uncharacterized membrane protein YGL010W
MLGNRSWDEWIAQYAASHRHAVNRACHTVGIPMIALSLLLLPLAMVGRRWLWLSAGLFLLGWALQFIGHAFEGKPPEFFRDWRFLFVGLRWWFAKVRGRA